MITHRQHPMPLRQVRRARRRFPCPVPVHGARRRSGEIAIGPAPPPFNISVVREAEKKPADCSAQEP